MEVIRTQLLALQSEHPELEMSILILDNLHPPIPRIAPSDAQLSSVEKSEAIGDWNALDTNNITMEEARCLAFLMFVETGALDLGITAEALSSFIGTALAMYNDTEFHNFQHAFCVLQGTFIILKDVPADVFDGVDRFALLLAALCHDVDHRGVTNGFECATSSDIAVRFNYQSVMENHHLSIALRLLQSEEIGILSVLSGSDKERVREIMIAAILGTDMSKHKSHVTSLRQRNSSESDQFDAKNSKSDRAMLLSYILHCADLSNAVRNWDSSREWTLKCNAEFARQVETERARGLPLSTHLISDSKEERARNEKNFIDYVITPLWTELITALKMKDGEVLLAQLRKNAASWRDSAAE